MREESEYVITQFLKRVTYFEKKVGRVEGLEMIKEFEGLKVEIVEMVEMVEWLDGWKKLEGLKGLKGWKGGCIHYTGARIPMNIDPGRFAKEVAW